jgi:hypothetical protein
MAKQKMVQFNNIWKDKGVPRELKIRILKCLIWPVVLYGSEAWVYLRKLEILRSVASLLAATLYQGNHD